MDAPYRLSTGVRLIVSLVYGFGVAAILVWVVPRSAATAPLIIIALSIPLVFGFVPRNWIYGLRTPRTLRGTDEVWYRHNRIAGIAATAVGIVWLVVAALR